MASTFAFQKDVPKLPIPSLKDTCNSYLLYLKPLQGQQEHEATKQAVADFVNGPVGPTLNDNLVQYDKTQESYIEKFWYESYLNYDSPVVLNLNPFFLLEDDPRPLYNTSQVKRAASLTISSLNFIRSLRREELAPDMVRGKIPMCMYQYTKLFGAARIPTARANEGCHITIDEQSRHVVVMAKSQMYWFDVLDHNNDLIMTENDLVLNYRSIVEDAARTPIDQVAQRALGVLTTETRSVWAKLRGSLRESEANRVILDKIDRALFVVCLDDVELTELDEISTNMLCGLSVLEKGVQVGTCTNRWYDKLQLIVTKNAKVGVNFEHTAVDGHTVLRFVGDIYTDSILTFARQINGNSPSLWKTESPDPATRTPESFGENVITIPRKLEWQLGSQSAGEISLALRFGETRLSDLIQQNEFQVLEFKNYGSNTIKKRFACSPDAFIQMAYQATYYALYGKVECTYEPAMTKLFHHGRTEAIRTVSEESNLFVRKFFSGNVSNKDKTTLLQAAAAKHSKTTSACAKGLGADRHLYALYCIWKKYYDPLASPSGEREELDLGIKESETPMSGSSTATIYDSADLLSRMPLIFADKGWERLNNTIISTSNCGNPALKNFGFGPVSANGFGIAYILKDESLTVCVSSKHRQTARFVDTLYNYLMEIENVFAQVASEAAVPTAVPKDVREGLATPGVQSQTYLNLLLGGYGYFDVGDDFIKSRGTSPDRAASLFQGRPMDSALMGHEKLNLVDELDRRLRLVQQ
ncbi:hypothetical protein BABINDRAFT_40322 [Babjeviella inositovora NRRL Y-12698]|uniref:Choline/carnitine acyltransferase domain-containing protein n=1 Tax=Babjeviella inositovora NRRL Y-12698 TaxID=984486 RepID=A0A1E3QLX7_9ASCO|nr:uncharacterized protein BABINDRAFT_40322 [Babjeviella inositovora NRRL Y-12698]ODQ77987.1 hypothetical protein BABINDRAFT_40322 [Babjeviella inositovora NRRL Y-12698]